MKVTKRRAHYGRNHPPCHDFQAAIPEVRDARPTKYSHRPVAFMTLIFEQFDDISLMAAQSINASRCYRTHPGRPDRRRPPSGESKARGTKGGEGATPVSRVPETGLALPLREGLVPV
jgi:hypothetical protein